MMAENLENLLIRIQKEGVEKAEQEAAGIIAKAREQAARIVQESEAAAKRNLEHARHEAALLTEQGIKTVEQAARDFILAIGKSMENLLQDMVFYSVGESFTSDTLMQMMVKLISAYAEKGFADDGVKVLLSREDQKTLVTLFMDKYRERFREGIDIQADDTIRRGFRVSLKSDGVFHDFTQEAIAESLCCLLQPQFAEIIHRVANNFMRGN